MPGAAGSRLTLSELVDRPQDHSAAIRRSVEAFLIQQGLLAGKPDGLFDEATRSALIRLVEG